MTNLFESAGVALVKTNQPDLKNWVGFLSQQDSNKIDQILQFIKEERNRGKVIYPTEGYELRIFRELKPDDVKIIILGQDPYHDGNATGIAFGCRHKITPSMTKIWEAIKDNCSVQSKIYRANPSLEYLVHQGVMLLNTTLTVEKGIATSHFHLGWEPIMRNIIKKFSDNRRSIIFMLWGKYAQSFKTLISPYNNHLILEADHPAHASYNNKKWDCNHFNYANSYLLTHNKTPIHWR